MPGSESRRAGCAAAELDDRASNALRRLLFALLLSAGVHTLLLNGLRVRSGEPQVLPVVLSARIIAEELDPPSVEGPRADPSAALGMERATSTAEPAHRLPQRIDRSASKRAAPAAPARVAHVASATGVRQNAALPEVAVPIARDPTWYPAKQLDAIPRALVPIEPKYRATGVSAVNGRVVVLLSIDESGTVTEASVVESEPEGSFEESALAASRAARFQPGSKDGRIVKSRVLVELRYGVSDRARAH